MADLARIVAAQARQIEELRRRARGRSREGIVTQADPAKGLVRVDVGTPGRPFVTGWIPAEALSTGDLAIQADPVVGQHVRVVSESGDLTDAVVALSSFSASAPRPAARGGELHLRLGSTRITATADGVTLESHGTRLVVSASGVAITGPTVTHGGTNIGRTHTHGGVDSGPSNTSTPN